jgi:TRAP-type C4-dicarboxylate transport system substrate-binding protein
VRNNKEQQITREIYDLNLAHPWPASHVMEKEIVQGWIKAVADATGGRVKITSYPGETLFRAEDTYEGVVTGIADIGLSAYAYNQNRFPVLETLNLPGLAFNSSVAASWAAMEAIVTMDPAELHDVHHLWTWASGPADLLTKKPVRNLEDLKGLNILTSDRSSFGVLARLGASPIRTPMSEWLRVLTNNRADGCLTSVESLQGFRLSESDCSYITLTPFLNNQLYFNVMNRQTWDSLPQDIQQGIKQATEIFYAENMPSLWDEINAAGLESAGMQKDMEIVVLSPAEKARWELLLSPVQEEHVRYLNEKGLPGADILKKMKDLANKYNTIFSESTPYIK